MAARPCWLKNWPPHSPWKARRRLKTDNSKLVGDRLNKQGDLLVKLVLDSARRVDLSTHPPESSKFIQRL